jgi:hypothetical protein
MLMAKRCVFFSDMCDATHAATASLPNEHIPRNAVWIETKSLEVHFLKLDSGAPVRLPYRQPSDRHCFTLLYPSTSAKLTQEPIVSGFRAGLHLLSATSKRKRDYKWFFFTSRISERMRLLNRSRKQPWSAVFPSFRASLFSCKSPLADSDYSRLIFWWIGAKFMNTKMQLQVLLSS